MNNSRLYSPRGWVVIYLMLSFSVCTAGDFSFDPNFDVNEEYSWASADASTADDSSPFFDEDEEPPQPRDKASFSMGNNTWGTGTASALVVSSITSAYSQARASVRWEGNTFIDDYYSKSFAQGAYHNTGWGWHEHIASSLAYAKLYGIASLEINSVTQPQGFPMYARVHETINTPYLRQSIGLGNTDYFNLFCGLYSLKGPSWSKTENYIYDSYSLGQIGDTVEFYYFGGHCISSASSSGLLDSEGEIGLSNSVNVDVRLAQSGESKKRFFGSGRSFHGVDENHPCMYAAMAMIIDYWARKYPELYQPTQADYYAALDKCRLPNLELGMDKFPRMMNAYFAGDCNNCRTGGPVTVAAMSPSDFACFDAENSLHPFILSGPQMTDSDRPVVPIEQNQGHAIVVDGIYTFYDGIDDPRWLPWTVDWLAVRDTWTDGISPVVSLDHYTADPLRRGFGSDYAEWWPIDALEGETLYFPLSEQKYRFRPMNIIEVIEYPRFFTKMLRVESFNDTWELLEAAERFRFECNDSNALIETMEPDVNSVWGPDPNSETAKLYIRTEGAQPATLLFSSYVTPMIQISFNYALTASATLQLRADGLLLDSISMLPFSPRGTQMLTEGGEEIDGNNLSSYSAVFDMNNLGLGGRIVAFAFTLEGPAGKELYLANLFVENTEAVEVSSDINGDNDVDWHDFALLSAHWGEAGCNPQDRCGRTDLDASGDIGIGDLGIFAYHWLDGLRRPPIPTDFTADGKTDFADFAILAVSWMQDNPAVDIAPPGGDGIIDISDFAILAENCLEGI